MMDERTKFGGGAPSVRPNPGRRMRPIDPDALRGILERHQTWVGSGWELGQRADLRNADLIEADLQGMQLEWADLEGASLRGANLREADLEDANLHGADLAGADLRGAELCWADLHEADLSGADLRGADLEDADLTGAELFGADLSTVKGLVQAQLDLAKGDPTTQVPAPLVVKTAPRRLD